MAYNHTVLGQLLKSVPRLEFEKLAQAHDGKRRSDALPRWSQFVSLVLGHLGNRHSLRDIESALATLSRFRRNWSFPRNVRPRIISDNGPQFTANDFKAFIKVKGMDHVRTSPYFRRVMASWSGGTRA